MKPQRNGPKICANILLFVLAILNVIVVLLPTTEEWVSSTWFQIIQTGLEGALAGACADWFAVTALFTSPLGLRLPHTSIIPRSQAQIARKVSQAISDHFLSDSSILECLKQLDLGDSAAEWIQSPATLKMMVRFFSNKIKTLPSGDSEAEHDEEYSPSWLNWLNRVQKDYMDEIIPDTGKTSGAKWKLWKRKNWSAWVYRHVMSGDNLSARTLIESYFLKDYGFERRKRDVQTLRDLLRFLSKQARSSEWLQSGSPKLEGWALKAAPGLRSLLESHVQKIIEDWDKDYLSQRVESLLGRHLAYIRINGTLCGFFVGAVIGAVHLFLR